MKRSLLHYALSVLFVLAGWRAAATTHPDQLILDLDLMVSNPNPLSGETFQYTISYSIISLTDAAIDGVIQMPLPQGMELLNFAGNSDVAGYQVLVVSGVPTLRISLVSPLAAGSAGIMTASVRMPPGTLCDGTVVPTQAVFSAQNADNTASSAASVTVSAPVAAWTTQVTAQVIGTPGNNSVFEVKLQPAAATGYLGLATATLSVNIPANTSVVSCSGCTQSGQTLSWALSNVTAPVSKTVALHFPAPPFTFNQSFTLSAAASGTTLAGCAVPISSSAQFTGQLPSPQPALGCDPPALSTFTIGRNGVYSAGFKNSGNVPVSNFKVSLAIPAQISITAISAAAYNYAGIPVALRYTTNLQATPQLLGNFNTATTPAGGFAPPVLPAGEYLTALIYDFGTVPPGFMPSAPLSLNYTVLGTDQAGAPVNGANPRINDPAFIGCPGNAAYTCIAYGTTVSGTYNGTPLSSDCPASQVARIPPVGPSELQKTAVTGSAAFPEDIVEYQLSFRVCGVGPLTNALVTDDLPSPLTLVPGSLTYSANLPGTPAFSQVGQQLRWNFSGIPLPGGGSVDACSPEYRLYFKARVPPGTQATSLTNKVTVDGDAVPIPGAMLPMATHTLQVLPVGPSGLEKTSVNGTYFDPGDTLTFHIRFRNQGAFQTTNVLILDPLAPGLNFIPGSVTYGPSLPPSPTFLYNPATRTLSWSWSSLPGAMPGGVYSDYYSLSYKVTIPRGFPPGPIQNCFSIDADGDNIRNDLPLEDCTTIVVNEVVEVESRKGVKGDCDASYIYYNPAQPPGNPANNQYNGLARTFAGGNADFRLVVRNTGNIAVKEINLIDILPYIGDMAVSAPFARLSDWRPYLVEQVTAPGGIQVYYSIEPNPCRTQFSPAYSPAGCTGPNWNVAPPADLTETQALRFYIPGQMAPGDSVVLIYRMQAPVNAPLDKVAWNSFAYQGKRADNSQSFLIAEPNKVGVVIKPKPPVMVSVGNYVWTDLNHDGIQNEGAANGVNEVKVTLYNVGQNGIQEGPQSVNPASDDVMIDMALTGNDQQGRPGYYLFNSLPVGNYYVVFDTSSFPSSGAILQSQLPTLLNQGNDALDSDADLTTLFMSAATGWLDGVLKTEDLTLDLGLRRTTCVLQPQATVVCDNRNTPQTSDDRYFFYLKVDRYVENMLKNANGFFTMRLMNMNGTEIDIRTNLPYGVNNPGSPGYGPFPISTGDLMAEVKDQMDPTCKDTLTIYAPATLGIVNLANTSCVVNGANLTYSLSGQVEIGGTPPPGARIRVYFTENGSPKSQVFGPLTPNSLYNFSFNGLICNGQSYTIEAEFIDLAGVRIEETCTGLRAFNEPCYLDITSVNITDNCRTSGQYTATVRGTYYNAPGAMTIQVTGGFVPPTQTLSLSALADGTNQTLAAFTKGCDGEDHTVTASFSGNAACSDMAVFEGPHDSDLGDLPNTYATTGLNNGPRHLIFPGIYLGDCVDSEADGAPDARAGVTGSGGDDVLPGDDVVCSHDDEDGVRLLTPLVPGQTACIEVKITTDVAARFNAWIDFNADGNFAGDAGDKLSFISLNGSPVAPTTNPAIPAGAGVYVFCFPVPANAVFPALETYCRYRLSSAGNLPETGLAFDGEVEDYWLPLAKIGDFVWHDENANGIQEGGETGISGATVLLSGTDLLGNPYSASTQTDNTGMYMFSGLLPGDYKLTFPTPGNYATSPYASSATLPAFDSDANPANGNMSAVENLSGGEYNQTYDAGFYQPASIGNYVWLDADADGRQDGNESGIANVKVILTGTDGAGNAVMDMRFTDNNGFYLFSGLAPGAYKLTFTTPQGGYVTTSPDQGADDEFDSDANPAMGGMTGWELLVSGEENLTYDAGYYLPAEIGNYTWIDADADGIQDGNEPPLPGVVVVLTGTTGTGQTVNQTALTDDMGFYLFSGLQPGTYKLSFQTPVGIYQSTRVNDPDASEATDSDADPAMGGMTAQEVLTSGESNLDYDAGYYAPAAIGNYVWHDLDADGKQDADEPGIGGATVLLSGTDGQGNPVSQNTMTDAAGFYLFDGLVPGEYKITFVQPPGFPEISPQNAGADHLDSDGNPANGMTVTEILVSGEYNPDYDQGYYTCPMPQLFGLPAGGPICPGVEIGPFQIVTMPPAAQLSWSGGAVIGLPDGSASGSPVEIPAFVATNEAAVTVTVTATLGACSESATFDLEIADNNGLTFLNCPASFTLNNDADKCGANVFWPAPVAADDCVPVPSVQQIAGPPAGSFVAVNSPVTITYRATDGNGNSILCSFTVTVADMQLPDLQCPAGPWTMSANNGNCTFTASAGLNASATDNCVLAAVNGLSYTLSGATAGSGTTLNGQVFQPGGLTTVTWTARDATNNARTCSYTVLVTDDDAPQINTCPPATTVLTAGNGNGDCTGATPNLLTALAATDNCTPANALSVSQSPPAGAVIGGQHGEQHVVTFTVTDAAGNTTTCQTLLTLQDNETPVFDNCPANATVNNDVDKCGAAVFYPAPTATDNCGGAVAVTLLNGPAPGAFLPVGMHTIQYRATDGRGLTALCTFTITVADMQAPKLNCPGGIQLLGTNGGNCTHTVSGTSLDATATDNCGVTSLVNSFTNSGTLDGAVFPPGPTVVGWTAKDAAGNQYSCAYTVVVSDDDAPQILTCPPALVVPTHNNGTGDCTANVPNLIPALVATDNCGIVATAQNPPAGSVLGAQDGQQQWVTLTVADAAGNLTTCQTVLTLDDTEAPEFVNCPATMLMQANDPDLCSAKVNWLAPVAQDNCGTATVSQTGGPLPGAVIAVGVAQTITYLANDNRGHTAVCSFQILVVDTQMPDYDADILMPGDVTVSCHQVPPPFVLTQNDVHDNCTAPQNLLIHYTQNSTQGIDPALCTYYQYTLTRTWKVTDQAGNMRVHTQVITVNDLTPPVAVCQPPGTVVVTLDKSGSGAITAAQIDNGSHDNCAGFPYLDFAVAPAAFTCADLGDKTVTLSVEDPCGNIGSCQTVVKVQEGIGRCTPEFFVETICVGSGNATSLVNGQFIDLITVRALAMQQWTLTANSTVLGKGLYSIYSSPPPVLPVLLPPGTPLMAGTDDDLDNDGDGSTDEADEMIYYTLKALHVDCLGYDIALSNAAGFGNAAGPTSVSIQNRACYPEPYFQNLAGPYCLGTQPFVIQVAEYNGAAGMVAPGSMTIDGVPGNTFNATLLGEGTHVVQAIFDAGPFSTNLVIDGQQIGSLSTMQADPGCPQPIRLVVDVVGTPDNPICNDLVHVSIDEDCEVTLMPDDVLEGDYPCLDDYLVEIDKTLPFGNGPWVPAIFHAADIGHTYYYHVVHTSGGNNICWGQVLVEDKLAPVVDCPDDVTVTCSESTDVSHTGNAVITDCSNFTVVIDDEYTDFGLCAQPRGQIVRTWIVTDVWGNQSGCTQTITITPFDLADVDFPADVVLNCEIAHHNPNATHPNTTGRPSIDGFPIGTGGLCTASINYTDEVFDICPGSYEILRTWKVRNTCLPVVPGVNPVEHVQVIRLEDTGGPQFTCPPNLTVSTNPLVCCATAALPDVIVSEGCSPIVGLEAKVTGTHPVNGNIITFTVPGQLADFAGNNAWLPDTLAIFPHTQCLPTGDYSVVYTAQDQCGNFSSCQFSLTVADLAPPIVACQQVTQVTLGATGVAEALAPSFDSGSFDNCCMDSLLVRRMGTICGDTLLDDFGPSVGFCCADLGDTVMVVLRAVDCAGNANECMVPVWVDDKLKPSCTPPADVAVSCENFDPSLWVYGFATAEDNCCLDTITVQDSYAQFDTLCNRGTIRRTFRASDCAGLATTCTQRIFVSYEQEYYVRFPADVIITACDGTGQYGEPVFFGKDCELLAVSSEDMVFTVVPDACFKIERTWTVIDWCTHNPNLPVVLVPNPEPNATANHPDNLPGPVVSPAGTASPWAPTLVKINATDAAPTSYATFYQANGNGYRYKQVIKIIDTQDPVVDNCPDTTVIACDYTQNEAQLWHESYWWDAIVESHDLCEGPVELSLTASDACSDENVDVRFLLFLDLDGDQSMETVVSSATPPPAGSVFYGNAAQPDFSGGVLRAFDHRAVAASERYGFAVETTVLNGQKIARLRWNTPAAPGTYVLPELPYGRHKIKWIVSDGCGNETVCEYDFEVKDCKPPSVYCYNGLSVNIMATGMIQLWASDFLQYGEDNCTPPGQLQYGIRPAGAGTGFPADDAVTFTCDALGAQAVELWAQDLTGNAAYCQTYVIVQDNDQICSPNGNATVAGFLETEPAFGGEGIESALLDLQGSHPALPAVSLFDWSTSTGYYAFGNALPLGADYTLTPVKDDNPMNGVSTFDLALISQHILGIQPLNSPYKIIAADVNKSNSVTTFDILELRKLILGVYTELPGNSSWRFLDAGFVFADPANPFASLPFTENISLADVQGNCIDDNFIGIKIGDVSGDGIANAAQSAQERTEGRLLLDLADRRVEAGELFDATFRCAAPAAAFQFTLNLDGLSVEAIADQGPVSAANFGVFTDALTVSIDGARTFTVRLRALRAGRLSEMLALSGRITRAEAYDPAGNKLDLALRFNGREIAEAGFELYPNEPNPWIDQTRIGFYLPEACRAVLTVTDETGRVLFVREADFGKGYQSLTLDRAVLPGDGVLYYTLETPRHRATRKMLRVR